MRKNMNAALTGLATMATLAALTAPALAAGETAATGSNIDAYKAIAAAFAIAIGGLMPAFAIGKLASKALEAIGRNPEAAPKIQGAMIFALAFAEAIAIYSLLVALIIKFL
jgi:F-type H+-transporting ATPase subunit c